VLNTVAALDNGWSLLPPPDEMMRDIAYNFPFIGGAAPLFDLESTPGERAWGAVHFFSFAVLGMEEVVGKAAVEALSPFRTILAEDGVKIIGVMTRSGVELEVAFEEVWEGTTLIVRRAHIQGASPGEVGVKELLRLAKQYGREQGAQKIVLEGAKRTTSSMAGKVPRPWVLDVNE
jgi:hypothetical protein